MRLLAALVFGAALGLPARAPAQGRPDCTVVLRKLDDLGGRAGAHTPDSEKVAKKLGVDADWIERCAESYGRRVKKSDVALKGESDVDVGEKREAEEFDEVAREEKDTADDHYVTVIENDAQDRSRLAASRNVDTVDEYEPLDTHEWEPHLGHQWEPFLHDDDHPGEE
jgi:hypothetical protein